MVTGDPQVLASVGSLLGPGPLALALLPLHASAAGAAVVRRAPVFLTEEGRQAMRLHWVHQKQRERRGLALCCPGPPSALPFLHSIQSLHYLPPSLTPQARPGLLRL